ncbi:cyclic nucleotide-binding domain-containing protein [Enterococcus termitis]
MRIFLFMKRMSTSYGLINLSIIFFLIDGRAKIYKIHENGKRSLLQFLAAGDFIGELSLLEVEEQVKDVQTIDRCICFTYRIIKQSKRC